MNASTFTDAVEIITLLANRLPEECSCNFELVEGKTLGQVCLEHRAQEWLKEATK